MVGGAGDDLRQGDAAAAADQGAVDGLGSRAGLARRVSGPQSINQDKPCSLTPNAVLQAQQFGQGVELLISDHGHHLVVSGIAGLDVEKARPEPG